MKKFIATIIGLALCIGSASHAMAQQNGSKGFFIGAGSGALLGQAIGRDTESTLIGTAIGSMLGYAIGNEMDKSGTVVTNRYPKRHYPKSSYKRNKRLSRKQHVTYETHIHHYPLSTQPQVDKPICREVEILATIDGYPEKVLSTACLINGYWVINNSQDLYDGRWQTSTYRNPYGNYSRKRLYSNTVW